MSMKQLDLFDNSDVAISQYGTPIEPNRLSRRDDPETSKIAAAEQAKKPSVLHRQIAEFLAGRLEPMTAREIAEQMKAELFIPAEIETIRKRVAECEDYSADSLGRWVVATGVRRCKHTGKLAETFGVRNA